MRRFFSRLRQHGAEHYAKWLAILIFSVPVLAGIFFKESVGTENRNLSVLPALPRSWPDALAYPGRIERWVNDHMGLRKDLIALNNRIRYALFRQFPTNQVAQGLQGRTFLVEHQPDSREYSAVLVPCGFTPRDKAIVRTELNSLVQEIERRGLQANILLVPSAPVIYPEQLPLFLQQRCQRQGIPMQEILRDPALSAAAKARIDYPLQAMLAAKSEYVIYPDTWFHWAGHGTRLTTELVMRRFGPANQAPPLVSRAQLLPSDISGLFPGLDLYSKVESIDFAQSGVSICKEAVECFTEVPEVLSKMAESARYLNPHAPLDRLLIISDSFGHSFAPWMSRYYREVVLVPTQNLPLLNEAELARLRQYLFDSAPGRQIMFVYHDATIHNRRLTYDGKYLFPAVFANLK